MIDGDAHCVALLTNAFSQPGGGHAEVNEALFDESLKILRL